VIRPASPTSNLFIVNKWEIKEYADKCSTQAKKKRQARSRPTMLLNK
jgi:hypothetical protein